MVKNITYTLKLSSCPHCGDNINIDCNSILGEKMLVNQFYKYFKWHLANECFVKKIRKKKKVSVVLKTKEGVFTTYTDLKLIV
jgi:hypothetical protein